MPITRKAHHGTRWVAAITIAALLAVVAGRHADRADAARPVAPAAAPTTKSAAPASAHLDGQVKAFFTTYCVECHGASKQKGDRRFDQLLLPAADIDTVLLLQDAVDAINLGDMPPKKAPKQPSAAELKQAVAAVTRTLADGRQRLASTGAQTVLRRLNRREYINTVGDLFGINMTMFDPTVKFPRDQVIGHMDNIGDGLRTSGYLLEQYLAAAEQVVDKAFSYDASAKERTWRFDRDFQQQPELRYSHGKIDKYRTMRLYESLASERHEGAYAPINGFAAGVPTDGYYEIRVLVEAKNRAFTYDPNFFGTDREAPFRLGIVPGQQSVGALWLPQPIEPKLAEIVIEDGPPQWKTMKVWLDAGHTPRFIFPNGMTDTRGSYGRLMRVYNKTFPNEVRNARGIVEQRYVAIKYGEFPQIAITEILIRGPIREPDAKSPQRIILGDKPYEPSRAREVLTKFASRAYRRPARADEVDRLVALVQKRQAQGQPPIEALKDGLKAALCSPSFLYLSENKPAAANAANGDRLLSAYDLASRLSYFLWATMPDDELMQLAASGEIRKPEVLRLQARRLLASPRSDAFVRGFIDSWLNLRGLGDMPPDRSMFRQYYAFDLQDAMYRETELFTRNLIDTNGSIADFIHSDYTYLNRPLARLYGMEAAVPPDDGHQFRKVPLKDPKRGGLLGQASVLTVSANGIETSPVTRGVWLLENILGTPPAPPPDNVPAIDPDVRGATSIRDLLTKHRENATCMECHKKIDPPGFALENFDPIGAWRTAYDKKIPIDSSGQLPTGQSFKDVAGLKQILLERKEQFAHMLTERLLTYACGRRIEVLDRPQLTKIVEEAKASGYGMRSLIEDVVMSETFRSK